ncbi:Zinc finger C2H2-type [Cinara cedri]|uniref:Zinc finger C2H2-type n=1 Tax=Cinara cedri TaxID=506608 RepID=A0A5E4N397_9HEMI|nr:Zinc finger C2H2-type [Cinara cedri]
MDTFECTFAGCGKVFTAKRNMARHAKSHGNVKIQCALCPTSFARKNSHDIHAKLVHRDGRVGPSNTIAGTSTGPSISTTTWTTDEENDALLADVCPAINDMVGFDHEGFKRALKEDTSAGMKKGRMELLNAPGFVEVDTSFSRKIVWHYAKNIDNIYNYRQFLRSIKPALLDLLKNIVKNNPIKFNSKLEATHYKPQVEHSAVNRAFKTSARHIYFDSEIEDIVERKLISEQDIYQGQGSGFSLNCIGGILLGFYKYQTMGGSSYLPLPEDIINKRAVVNPQNIGEKCFKWTEVHDYRINHNYTKHENKYDFSGLTYPTPMADIKNFEKNNNNVSVNVYALEKEEKNPCSCS